MKYINTHNKRGFFKPLIESASAQAAMMVLKPGQSSSDDIENEHPKAEQWLYVVSGSGRARVGRRSVKLAAGSLLCIERRERHQVTNVGSEPMITLNLYLPPAYTKDGNVKPSVE